MAPDDLAFAPKPDRRLAARLRYAFDNSMAGGLRSLVALLAAGVLAVAVLSGVLLVLLHIGPDREPLTAAYRAVMHMIDTGGEENDTGSPYQVIDLIVTLFGLVVVSAFVGILVASLEVRLQQLRKGRSLVSMCRTCAAPSCTRPTGSLRSTQAQDLP